MKKCPLAPPPPPCFKDPVSQFLLPQPVVSDTDSEYESYMHVRAATWAESCPQYQDFPPDCGQPAVPAVSTLHRDHAALGMRIIMVIITSTVCQQSVVSMLTTVWGDIATTFSLWEVVRFIFFIFFLDLSISLTLTSVYQSVEAAKDELFWFLESLFKER